MKRYNLQGSRKQMQGLALVELMIAMTLGLILIGAATAVMLSNTQTFRTTKNISQIQNSANLGFELMARDIRQAGSMPCGNGIAVTNLLTGPENTMPWYFDWAGKPKYSIGQNQGPSKPPRGQLVGYAAAFDPLGLDNRVPNTETLTVLYASNEGLSVKKFNAAGSSYVLDDLNSNFVNNNDFIFICNTQFASIFRALVSEGRKIEAGELSNKSTIPGSFNKNAMVGKLKSRAWYIGLNDQGRRSLYLSELTSKGLQHIEIAPGVHDLKLRYRTDHNTIFNEFTEAIEVENSNLWPKVNAVEITFELEDQDSPERFKHSFSSIVAVRNRSE